MVKPLERGAVNYDVRCKKCGAYGLKHERGCLWDHPMDRDKTEHELQEEFKAMKDSVADYFHTR